MTRFVIPSQAPVFPFEKKWQFCVGSGQAALAVRADYAGQLRQFHDELGIERVRFHGILNGEMQTLSSIGDVLPMPDGGRFPERSFHLCGVAYDNVIAAGMKPFVELSFIPEKLCKPHEGASNIRGASIGEPRDLDEFAEYIEAFIRYLFHRYGQDEVETWFFEVWNEPDLQGAFFYGTQADYFRLYETVARRIKSISPALKVGGPSTSASKWIPEFVAFCRDNQVPLDFVTTHQYAGDPLTGVSGEEQAQEAMDVEAIVAGFQRMISALPQSSRPLDVLRATLAGPLLGELHNDVFIHNARVVREQAGGLPVYYTEWNTCATFAVYDNDTRRTAAYNLKNALETDRFVDGSSIWCFSDIFDEMHQFTEEFHGGFGMMTLDGVPKPVFHALKMLALAGRERLDLGGEAMAGEVGIAAFRKGQATQVILVRQRMNQETLPKEPVCLEIEAAQKPGRVTLRRIDEDHCNPLRVWEEMGRPMDCNRQEVQTMIDRSRLTEEDMDFTWHEGRVQVECELGVNDIYMIEVE